MRATPESPRMFEQDWLDALSRTPWWTVPLLWLPLSVGSLVGGIVAGGLPVGGALGVAAAGWLLWTLAEYGLHRTFFHWIPNDTWGARMHFLVHGVHHEWHQDPYRLVMPPAVSLLLGVLFGSLFYGGAWLLGQVVWVGPLFGGFTFGYMVYDITHYLLHHRKWSGTRFQALKRHHLLHHHSPKHADRKFGVSTTLWDHVFGTF